MVGEATLRNVPVPEGPAFAVTVIVYRAGAETESTVKLQVTDPPLIGEQVSTPPTEGAFTMSTTEMADDRNPTPVTVISWPAMPTGGETAIAGVTMNVAVPVSLFVPSSHWTVTV